MFIYFLELQKCLEGVLRMNFRVQIFSGVYHPQDTWDEKVSSVLPNGEHGEIEPLDPSRICWICENSMENPWTCDGLYYPSLIDTFWCLGGIWTPNREGLALYPLIVRHRSTDFPWIFHGIQRIPDGSRGSISPCSLQGKTQLTFSSRVSWGG